MRIVLESIQDSDSGRSAGLVRDEVLEHRISLNIDGTSRSFTVFVRANVLTGFDATLVYGDELLEELLRFEPRALNKLYSTVGKHRRGTATSLPLVILDQGAITTDVPAGPP